MPSSTCVSKFRTTTRSNNYVPMLGDLHPACFVQWYFDRAASAETNIGLCTHTASRISNCATGRLRSLSAQSSTMMRSRSRGARTRRLSITLGPTLLRCCTLVGLPSRRVFRDGQLRANTPLDRSGSRLVSVHRIARPPGRNRCFECSHLSDARLSRTSHHADQQPPTFSHRSFAAHV